MTVSPLCLFIASLGLAFVLEGSLYFLFPDYMKKLLEQMQNMGSHTLRNMGLGVIVVGLILMYMALR